MPADWEAVARRKAEWTEEFRSWETSALERRYRIIHRSRHWPPCGPSDLGIKLLCVEAGRIRHELASRILRREGMAPR